MAITRAQQARQMLKDGDVAIQGGVENYLGRQPEVQAPRKWQSGPDKPPTELAYITEAEKKLLLKEDIHGSLKEGPNEGPAGIMSLDSFGDIGGAGAAGVDTSASGAADEGASFGPTQSGAGGINKPMSPADVKLAEQRLQTIQQNEENKAKEFTKQAKKQKSFFNQLKKFGLPTQKVLYNVFPNNPKRELEFLSSLRINDPAKYDTLPQNLKDLLESTDQDFAPSFEDSPKLSYEDFKSLIQFDDGAFAQYAKDRGSPGLSVSGDMSQVGIKSVRRDEFGNPVKDMFGNTLFDYGPPQDRGGDDGSPQGDSDLEARLRLLEEQNAALKNQQNDEDLTGGMAYRFMNRGGMPMDAPTTGGIMDLETGRQMYFLGKLVKKATRAVKKIVKSPIGKAAVLGGLAYFGGGGGLPKFLGGKGIGGFTAKTLFSKANPLLFTDNKLSIGKLAAASALTPFLFSQEEEEEDQTTDRGPGLDIARIRANPYTFIPRRFAAEGGDIEPVAKKTMPLLDMGGKEMDFREDGGFVPIGRMERADDVPARLSKNEFVFTADAVRNAGDGDIDKGAEVMYNMMKNLESGGDVSEESQGLQGAREMFQTSKRLEEVL